MTIDDKVAAAREYVEWRDENNVIDSLEDGVERWRAALVTTALADMIERVRGFLATETAGPEQMRAIADAVGVDLDS